MSIRATMQIRNQSVLFFKGVSLAIFSLFISLSLTAQTTLYNQSFEVDLMGYSHTPDQLPSVDASDQYFHNAMPSDGAIYEGSVGPYTGVTGDFLFVGSNPNTFNGGNPGEIIFDQISIAGFTNIVFSADFGGVPNDWDATDLLSVEYSIDGGAFTELYSFASPVTNDPLELLGNATGGANTPNGTVLTYALQTITSDAIGTGSTLDLKIVCNSNANYEAFGVDNVTVTGVASGGNPIVSFAASTGDVPEEVGTYDICVSIVNPDPQIPATATVSLTAGGTATNGTDINTYADQVVTFPAGDATPQCVTITIVDDAIIDEDETLIFELTNVTGADLGSVSSLTLTIIDNDKLTCDEPVWNVVSPLDAEVWSPIMGGFEANGFCGGGCMQDVETWLIYGPLDMTGVGLLELEFTGAEGFGVTDLNVQYSSEEGANVCPNEVAWTSVGIVDATGDYSFDFSAATGTEVYLAIEYTDDGADGYSAWDVTDFALFADVCPTVGTFVSPEVSAGEDVVQCGIAEVQLEGSGDGVWSGGAGSFDDETSPTATYTPDATEEGTTVELTYTLNIAACSGFSDAVSLTFFEEPGDTEFSYGAIDICPNTENLVVIHTTGEDGIYTVTMGDETAIDLDPNTGEINVMNTADGVYEITNTIAGCGNIMITGVIDGTLSGGEPKAAEFYTLDYIPDLSAYSFGSENSADGGGVEEFVFPPVAVEANTYFYLANNQTQFNTFFGFDPDFTSGAISVNGDDALELFCDGAVIDAFGDVNTDGTGEAWEYTNSWAYRVSDTGINVGEFNDTDFTYLGPNGLSGVATNSGPNAMPIQTFTTTQPGICPNSSTSVTITVGDTEGPVVDCPGDIIVNLDAGECRQNVHFDIPFMDNCGTLDGEASQLVNDAIINNALDCTNNTSNHLRIFENILPVPLDISQVTYGVWNSTTEQTVTINIYTIPVGAAFVYANMDLVATVDDVVAAGTTLSLLNASIEATIPVGSGYVVEIKAPNSDFIIGYNTVGETGSSYVSGNLPVPCVSLEPVDIDGLNTAFIDFALVVYTDATGGPSIEQTAGLPSGAVYEIGTTTNTFIVTDVNGNTTECTFDVTINEFADPNSSLACNDNINISLDQNCEVVVNADMILEGGNYGCYEGYEIAISGVTGNVITEPGSYSVTITDLNTGNSCWGDMNVEGKSVPVLDCAATLCPLEMLVGEWTEDDNTFSPGADWAFDGGAPNADILYDEIEFTIEVGGEYTFTMTPSEDFDGIAGIYAGSFDPNNAGENLIGGDDDIPGVLESEPEFTIILDAGDYVLVSSTWGAGQMGIYTWSFSGPGDLLAECQLKCYELDAFLAGELDIPGPDVTSCTPATVAFSDVIDDSDCGVTTITRTYLATNENGSASCEVVYEFDPLSVEIDIVLPVSPVLLTCGSGTDPVSIVSTFDNPLTLDNPNTGIVERNEGYQYAYPTFMVNGHAQKIDNQVCNIYAGYTDQDLDACGEGCNGNKKVIRTWTIVDWCSLETSTFAQIIKAVDDEGPTFILKDITLSTDPWGCSSNVDVPQPWELHDNCTDDLTYTVSGPTGVVIVGDAETGYTALNVPKGTHTFKYTASDCCGNTTSEDATFTIYDGAAPVVVVKQNIVISLTSSSTNTDGIAKMYPESIDNGSYDGCTDVHYEVRRDGNVGQNDCDVLGNNSYNDDNHPFDGSSNPNSPTYDPDGGAYVKFCCNDISNAVVDVDGDGENDPGYVKVWLRVWDDGDMDGLFGTAGDNYNESWAYVKVEDKLSPTIVCPPDVTLTCDMDYTDLDVTGRASGYASCGGLEVEWNDIVNTLNTCNDMGFIRRRWNIVGRTDIFCDQRIDMTPLAGDDPVVRFTPQLNDKDVTGCPEDIELSANERPTWVAGPCDVLGYTVEADTFYFEDGACLKIVREWTVINWCDYDPNNDPDAGVWRHTQVVKVTDDTQPTIESCDDLMFEINDHSDSDDDGNVCEAKITLINKSFDPGSDNCPTGWLKWQVFVDLWGDGTYDLEYSSFLPTNDGIFNDTNGNGIGDVYLRPTENGATVSVPLPDIEGSMSNHKVDWKVTDGCNNVRTCSQNFMVVDKKAPTPYMVDLSSAVMEVSCSVELWAIDFNIGSFDNCSPQESLRYTFSSTAPEDDSNYLPLQHSSSMLFTAEDVANSPIPLTIYVWDEKGNADFAIVNLTLVDNHGCIDPPMEDPFDNCTCDPTEYTGWAVGTCNAEEDTNGAVGVIYDIRNTQDAPNGSDFGASIASIHPENWTIDQIGQVYGIAIDNADNVYLSASDVYDTQFDSDPYGPGQIFKASSSNDFLAEPFVALPNTGGALNGIGNIAFCNDNSMLYASNLEDGMIYRINPSGVVMETYDPWGADNGNAGIAPTGEQVWGIGLNTEEGSKKLYFGRIAGDAREMYSIALNDNGSFPSAGSEELEFDNIMGTGFRITDIAFNTAGDQMVFAERGTKFLTGAHTSKTLRYDLNGGAWSMELQYFVGGYVTDDFPSVLSVPGENSAGGVDFGATTVGSSIDGCDELVWSSMNYFEDGQGGLFYGMQGMSADGNNSSEDENNPNYATDIIIDYDGDYTNFVQKGDLGDVEIFKCGGSATSNRVSISGVIKTENGNMVDEVETKLISSLPEIQMSEMVTGTYAFNELPMDAAYEVSAEKNHDWLNGVSTLDLVKIQRHILGIESLDSPYKVVAADINNDEAVKANDLAQLRKLILGTITEIGNNTSWKFVNASQEFDNISSPWPIQESIESGVLHSDMVDQDLIAVKIGDVTNNVVVNGLVESGIEVRSAKTIDFVIENQTVKAGEEVEVTFTSADFADVYGYQFTMELNGLEFASVQGGAVSMTDANVGVLSNKVVTVSYNTSTARTAGQDEAVFTATFVATKDGSIANMIDVTSKVTLAEAYVGESLEIRDVTISTRGDIAIVATTELFQNEPNPFKGQTVVAFNLAEAAQATITVFDVTGKVIVKNNIDGVKGYNSVNFTANQLGTSGVLFYTLESGEFTATKKMIIIE